MTEPLLQTKLSIQPLRPHLVDRTHLLERLNDGLWSGDGFARKLTLLSAGAGYGKSTLLAAWLQALAGPASHARASDNVVTPAVAVAWLTLDDGDNDSARFLAYLITAFHQVQPDLGGSVKALLDSPRLPPPAAIMTALINELAASTRPAVLAIDDYQVIHTQAIHDLLAFLLEHQPQHLHVALASREDPPLPLARLRARGQLAELRQADLRFTPKESAAFLGEVMGLRLPADAIAALDRRTEGWIAGLQLAALSLQGRDAAAAGAFVQAFSGSNRFVLDYLIEEVFRKQPPEVQEFLLKTSLLDRLAAPLCDAVWLGSAGAPSPSQGILDYLEQSNLFVVPVEPSRTWYRYHHLFADLLRHQLRRQAPDSEPPVHERASIWYEGHGLLPEAIGHALAASDWSRAARLIHQIAGDSLRRGEIGSLLSWLERLPAEVVAAQPPLCLDYAWPLLLAGQLDAAETWLARAEALAATVEASADSHVRPFLGQIASARAYQARGRGDMRRAVAMAQQALALLPETDHLTRGLVAMDLGLAYWHAGMMADAELILRQAYDSASITGNAYARLAAEIFLARVMAVRGELVQAAAALRQAVQQGIRSPVIAAAYLDLAALHFEWNDLDTAAGLLHQATRLAERADHGEFLIAAHLLAARLRAGQGDFAAAMEAVRDAYQRGLRGDVPSQSLSRTAAGGVEVALAQGDRGEAERWARQAAEDVDAHPFYRFLGLTRGRLLLAEGHKQAAAAWLAAAAERASQAGWIYGLIAARVLQALAADSADAAVAWLADGLARGRPGHFVRAFADAGPALVPLLHDMARRDLYPEAVGEILDAMQSTVRSGQPAGMASANAPTGFPVETLSIRELEVLRLMAAGLSNAAIAERLVVSEGTVKTHVHHICGKLGAENRTQAVARGREIHLL